MSAAGPPGAPGARSRRTALWLVAALLALHNLEEAVTFPRYLPTVRARVPPPVSAGVAAVSYPQLLAALAVVTLVPLAVVVWAQRRPGSRVAVWSVLLIQAVVLLNVGAHVASAAMLLRGYSPGLATALALNLPFSLYLFRRARRERWVGRRGLLSLAPAAIVVHGPLLVGLVLLAGTLVRRR